MKMLNAIELLGARNAVHNGLAETHAAKRHNEVAAYDALHAGVRELEDARAAYAQAPSDESLRLRVRASGSRLVELGAAYQTARAAEREADLHMQKAHEGLVQMASYCFDLELVEKASAKAAIGLLPAETARKWAAGDADVDELRSLFAAIAQHEIARQALNAQGANWQPCAWTLFILPLLQALFERGIVAVGSLWRADDLPPREVFALKIWAERVSDLKPQPAAAKGMLDAIANIVAAVNESDCRTLAEYEELHHANERERLKSLHSGSGPRPAPLFIQRLDQPWRPR